MGTIIIVITVIIIIVLTIIIIVIIKIIRIINGDGGLVGCLVGSAMAFKVLPGMLLHDGRFRGGWMLQDLRGSTMGVAEIPNLGAGLALLSGTFWFCRRLKKPWYSKTCMSGPGSSRSVRMTTSMALRALRLDT